MTKVFDINGTEIVPKHKVTFVSALIHGDNNIPCVDKDEVDKLLSKGHEFQIHGEYCSGDNLITIENGNGHWLPFIGTVEERKPIKFLSCIKDNGKELGIPHMEPHRYDRIRIIYSGPLYSIVKCTVESISGEILYICNLNDGIVG